MLPETKIPEKVRGSVSILPTTPDDDNGNGHREPRVGKLSGMT